MILNKVKILLDGELPGAPFFFDVEDSVVVVAVEVALSLFLVALVEVDNAVARDASAEDNWADSTAAAPTTP